MSPMQPNYSAEQIKEFALHLNVRGAYVQTPVPGIYGIEDNVVLSSSDATALYPISQVNGNIGYDTLRDRLFESVIVQPILSLIARVFQAVENEQIKDKKLHIINSAVVGFQGGIVQAVKEFAKVKALQNKKIKSKKSLIEFTNGYYGKLMRKILMYSLDGGLEDIFYPKDDRTYYLLKSYLCPILEAVTWINKHNKEYSQIIVNYIFHNEDFKDKYADGTFFIIREVNSTKSRLEVLNYDQLIKLFDHRILNPYGTLFDRHEDNLSFEVNLIIDSLKKRKIGKDKELLLSALIARFDRLTDEHIGWLIDPTREYLTQEEAGIILDAIDDSENRHNRIQSFIGIEFNIPNKKTQSIELLLNYMRLRNAQYNAYQSGVKVTLNSGYGLFASITFIFGNQLIGNSITTSGKIFGVKLFQSVTAEVIDELEEDITNKVYELEHEFKARHPEYT